MWITFAVVGVIVAYAALSLINSLVAALARRRRELTLLRLAGATRRQVRRMLEAEALVIAGVGASPAPRSRRRADPAGDRHRGLAAALRRRCGCSPPCSLGVAALVLLPTLAVSRSLLNSLEVDDVEMA